MLRPWPRHAGFAVIHAALGHTPGPDREFQYTCARFAELMNGLLNHLHVERYAFCVPGLAMTRCGDMNAPDSRGLVGSNLSETKSGQSGGGIEVLAVLHDFAVSQRKHLHPFTFIAETGRLRSRLLATGSCHTIAA
jgi:hypothetical protein